MSEDFWTRRHTCVELKPACVALRYRYLVLLYSLLLELDRYFSKPIKGLDEAIRTKVHKVFMSRWSAFHAPVHSAAFAMDRQFCRRYMDDGVKKDIWSVMADFSKGSWGQGFEQDEVAVCYVCGCCGLHAGCNSSPFL
jgi:hypothetical protein